MLFLRMTLFVELSICSYEAAYILRNDICNAIGGKPYGHKNTSNDISVPMVDFLFATNVAINECKRDADLHMRTNMAPNSSIQFLVLYYPLE